MTKKLLLQLLVCLVSLGSFAQETTSEIRGIITDKSGSIANATISALHVPTGTAYATTSRKDGRYNLPNLRVGGPYTISVSFVGFKSEQQENVFLVLGQEFTADFSLASAATTLTDVVVGTTRQDRVINTNRTGSQEVISRNQLDRLPTINRSLQDFTKLTPTANGSSFGGRNGSYNNLTVDGAQFNNAFGLSSTLGGQTNSQPISLDAIEQIQVSLAPFDIRQGGFTGAGINSVTKSGTNQLKASIYTYIKSPGLTGTRVKQNDVLRQQFNYNQRGATLGGAMVQNKLFFFVSGEQERIDEPGTSLVASRNGASGAGISQAKAEDLDALRSFLLSKYNYNAGDYEGYKLRTNSDKLTVKFDWNINTSNTFSIKYNYLKSFRDVPASNSGSPSGGRQPGTTQMPFNSSFYTINNNFNIFIAELNTRFSNKASNKLQIGYTSLRDFRASLGGSDFPLVDIENGQGRTFTSFGYEPFTYNNKLNTDVLQFNDIFTRYAGKHELVFGTQNNYKKFENGFAPTYNGAYRFKSLADFYASANNGTANSIRYELRYSALKGGEFPFAKVGALELGVFAQDRWRMTDRFTLTYGLRIDMPVFDKDFENNTNVEALTFREGIKASTATSPKTQPLFSPRVGVNYDVKGDQTLQVRGGVGIFSGPPPFVWISNQASNNGVQFGSFVRTTPVAFSADVNAYRPTGGAANNSYNLVFTEKNFKYPQVFRTSAAVDHKLPGNLIVTLEGLYTKDINGVYFQNINLPQYGAYLAGADPRLRFNATKIYSGAGGLTAANPDISDAILMKNTNKGYAYNVTLQVQKTLRNWFFSAAYSYGESKSVNDGGSIAQSMWRDRAVSSDPNSDEVGFSNFYQPHRVIASASYRKEYAKYFATSVGFIFEAAPAGVSSYVYNGDVNNDGLTTNDLMYIPRDKSEIVLEGVSATDTRTADQIYAQLDNYIKQDYYLSRHRGEVVERNSILQPYLKRLDMNFTQDFYVFLKDGKKNTIRFTFDIINVGNFINRRWGVAQTFNNTTLLNFKRVETTGLNAGKPVFSFPYFDVNNQIPLTNTFRDNVGLASRWQGQVGIRYIFNN